ncbi:MAG TPA: SDR family oxidoreductase, partial [Vicinamibacteria bacterium]|nr:SDR family oxidoreductase [Vicinamibacteria bacterium]
RRPSMILVTGATGTVGSEVVKALSARQQPFRAGYRSRPQNVPAGMEAVQLDFERPETIGPALRGVETLFLLSSTVAPEANVARAAGPAGVRRIVKLSVWGAGQPGFTIGAWHRGAEEAVERSGAAWTILRPNGYMQNVVNFMAPTIKAQGALYSSAAGALISHIDARDIGEIAALVLTEGGHEGKTYELGGPAGITYDEMASVLTRELGRPVRYVPVSDEDYKQAAVASGVPEAYADALVNLNRNYRDGGFSRVAPDTHRLLGRVPTSFEQFARDYAAALR